MRKCLGEIVQPISGATQPSGYQGPTLPTHSPVAEKPVAVVITCGAALAGTGSRVTCQDRSADAFQRAYDKSESRVEKLLGELLRAPLALLDVPLDGARELRER